MRSFYVSLWREGGLVSKRNYSKGKSCVCCGFREEPNANGKHPVRISTHHIPFPHDAILPQSERHVQVKNIFWDLKIPLCMSRKNDEGCHNRFNYQITKRCCGISNVSFNGSGTRVLIGICPLISGRLPLDPKVSIPNKFCAYCFYFQAIASPKAYRPLMELISLSPSYDGIVTPTMLNEARDRLTFSGIAFIPKRYRMNNHSGAYTRKLWRPDTL